MKLGIDLVEISGLAGRNLDLSKIYTTYELESGKSQERLAGIFAAKEAFFKAVGQKIDWLDVWVENEPSGKPRIFSNYLSKNETAEVSITYTKDYAAAAVIIFNK